MAQAQLAVGLAASSDVRELAEAKAILEGFLSLSRSDDVALDLQFAARSLLPRVESALARKKG